MPLAVILESQSARSPVMQEGLDGGSRDPKETPTVRCRGGDSGGGGGLLLAWVDTPHGWPPPARALQWGAESPDALTEQLSLSFLDGRQSCACQGPDTPRAQEKGEKEQEPLGPSLGELRKGVRVWVPP